jgi:hypothetical protein
MKISKQLLVFAGITSFSVALFQAVITFSPAWSRYFGAPEALVSNIPLLYAAGFVATAIFVIFGLYGISGAGCIRPLPLLRLGLLGIGCVYLLRGLLIIPMLLVAMGYLQFSEPIPDSGFATSLVSLCTGILYLAGILGRWKEL